MSIRFLVLSKLILIINFNYYYIYHSYNTRTQSRYPNAETRRPLRFQKETAQLVKPLAQLSAEL